MEKKRYKIQFAARLMTLLLVLSALFTTALGIGRITAKADETTLTPAQRYDAYIKQNGYTNVNDSRWSKVWLKDQSGETVQADYYVCKVGSGFSDYYVFTPKTLSILTHTVQSVSAQSWGFSDEGAGGEYYAAEEKSTVLDDCFYCFRVGFATGDNLPEALVVVTYTLEQKITQLPEPPTKEGHTFVGWYYDEEYTQPYNGEPITADTTLYAKFEISRYTVTFDSMGGSACEPVTVDWNTTVTDLPTPTKEGYDFIGWYIGNAEYTGGAVTANITLTAKWQIKVYTVTFMVGEEVYKTVEVEHGTTFYEAMKRAGMQYYNLLDAEGKKDGKGGLVTESVTVYAAEMTKEEKAAQFWADNTWLPWALGGAIGVLVIALSVAIVIAKKRR